MNTPSFPNDWGWNAFFNTQVEISETDPSWKIARVINQEKNLYKLQVASSQTKLAQLAGKFSYNNNNQALAYPAVGDWVLCQFSEQDDRALIQKVLDRKSCFYRGTGTGDQVVATNVDVVFIVTSANDDFNLNRLDRYLAVAWDSGASPVIVLSKIDLCEDPEELLRDIEDRHIGVPVVAVTVTTESTVQELKKHLRPGATAVLMGSSGVGKSTLTNALLGQEIALTQGIREDDDKGKHTTTSRQLYRLPDGALLMDTPGMRSLALSDHTEGLEHQFEEIVRLESQCKFSDCRHENEPGCRILEALENEELDIEQWNSYQKLQKEVRSSLIRSDKVLMAQEQKKWKQISKDLRQKYNARKKGIY